MLSDQGKRLQARKRFVKRAAMAPTKERDYASGAAAAYDAELELLALPALARANRTVGPALSLLA